MQLTAQVYAEFQTAYVAFNVRLFEGALPDCIITLQRRDKRSYGYYSPKRFGHRTQADVTTDEIALNPLRFKTDGPLEALQTLAHEMAHLWQQHYGNPGRECYHNREWADKMESIGLMPSSTGRPGGAKTGQKMGDYAIEGGQFLSVANELLAGPFALAWYDRAEEILAAAAGPTAIVSATGVLLGIEPAPGAKPKSKVKFQCTQCKARAWGKPTLRIKCGEHNVPMEVSD